MKKLLWADLHNLRNEIRALREKNGKEKFQKSKLEDYKNKKNNSYSC